MKATPVPLVSPRLPNTIVQMFTAVPRFCGIRSRRRYSRARSVFHELNTARIAMSSCSRGCCGNSWPECSRTASLKVVTNVFRSSTSSSMSLVTPLDDLALSSASENTSPGISSTVLPNICNSRR